MSLSGSSRLKNLDSPSALSLKNFPSGLLQSGFEISPEQSLDGSFRKSDSVISGTSISTNISYSFRRVLKDYAKKFVDVEAFTRNLEGWVLEKLSSEDSFGSPFTIDELRKLDVALEGVLFQQLLRMPYDSESDALEVEEEKFLAVEDLLHTISLALWRTFWHRRRSLPLYLSCPRHPGSKLYTVEKAISRGTLGKLALVSTLGSNRQARWDHIMEFVLFKQDILSGNEFKLSGSVVCEAIFYGFHMLVSRSLSKPASLGNNCVFVLVVDSRYGAVIRIGADLGKLEMKAVNAYEWIKEHAEIRVSPVELIWNKLGNPNWGDLGTLQLVLATFYSIAQWNGPPRKSIASLASNHTLRLHTRFAECRLGDTDRTSQQQGEIVEVNEDEILGPGKRGSRLRLQKGQTLVVDDLVNGHKAFEIEESLVGGKYRAVSMDEPTKVVALHVGAHTTQLEPSWEDMSLWYQVQRQTKVLTVLKQVARPSKYLPEMVGCGRVVHMGACTKKSAGGRCDHPWCGTPVLATAPVGQPVSWLVGRLSAEEAVRLCRDCVAALASAAAANVQHGDICPENIMRVEGGAYVLVSWGRAVLEERDRAPLNLDFSSGQALQHGKLCPSSDAESLVYVLMHVCGGGLEPQESMEGALLWRERMWAQRVFQRRLGQLSPLLKAFADYVDILCGTPYPFDYHIWLTRLTHPHSPQH